VDLTSMKTCYEFFFFIFFRNERKKLNIPHNFFPMLKSSKNISKAIPISSSITWSMAHAIPTSFFNLKLIVIKKFKASFSNQ
jgi:hypothetical protein